MLDVIKRACLHPISYSGYLRSTQLQFKEKIQESENVYSFIFTAEKLPGWKAGQHAVFSFPKSEIEGKCWRPFSVASAPHENEIRIGTNIPEQPSSFKQKLMGLTAGDTILMQGPFGEFYAKTNIKHIIGIAGGIGITPFRSIASDLTSKQNATKLTLIYSAQKNYTYQSELESWKEQNPNIQIIYTHTPEEVNTELERQVAKYGNNSHYFIAGPPGMISALRKYLTESGIRNITNDPFKGY